MLRLAVVGLLLFAAIAGWALWPTSAEVPSSEDPAGTGQDAAFHRWEDSQPTHWRYVVMSRD